MKQVCFNIYFVRTFATFVTYKYKYIMSLKGLKEKFIEKRITNVLKNRETHYNSNKIEHLGIIINADEIADFEFLKTLTETLNLRPNKLKIITFTQNHK